ncbi:alpha/beta hydrolase [Crocinitomicaceae bacterium]|nr:alpha/beta hydrolase [Crocinitomicaceae bacterium]
MQISIANGSFYGANKRESLYDLIVPNEWNGQLIVFLHGYMGYKDWGCWNLVQDYFTSQNFGFLKYNVSHNGGTPEKPIDFTDLEAFSTNSYSKEIEDFEAIIECISQHFDGMPIINVIGHSRGGGIALLQSKNKSIHRIASWAGISTIEKRFPVGKALSDWKQSGIRFLKNGRTKQNMPHSYSQYTDYLLHKERLNIENYCKTSEIPTLIVHGENDTSVLPSEAEALSTWLNTSLIIIKETQHTFGSAQPWEKEQMPQALESACEITLSFFKRSSPGEIKTKKLTGQSRKRSR